jgi:hypothetical protein
MSVEDVVKIKGAYEKMLQDGSAFKKIDMPLVMEPNLAEAEHGLGDKVDNTQLKENNQPQEEEYDWSAVDEAMQRRMNSLKAKMNDQSTGQLNSSDAKRITMLEKKVAKLEQALMLVMETHERLLG